MKLAIFASGEGSTSEPLFKWAAVVITNNPDAGIIDRAKKHQVPYEIIPRAPYRVYVNGEIDVEASRLKHGEAMLETLEKYQPNFISLNGFSILIPEHVIKVYKDRITNSHPAPLDPGFPDFGGQGMHGLAVHEAVIRFSKMVKRPFHTQVTIHKVTEEYDKGEVLVYSKVKVESDDTAESLQDRVKEVEIGQNEYHWKEVQKRARQVKLAKLLMIRVIWPGE